jgi:uncharacterized membrane protein (UPF0127 family)
VQGRFPHLPYGCDDRSLASAGPAEGFLIAHIFQSLLGRPDAVHRLVNCNRGIVLAGRVEPAFDSATRRKGLLGRSTLASDTVLAIAPSNAVHTFGMQFPIDVLFIDRDGVVVKRVLNLKARRIAAALRAFAVLEFAAGSPTVAATQVGDRLEVESADNSQIPTAKSQIPN